MESLADIHCHILPYVDDGAEHLENAVELLRMDVEQGVRLVCATPHLRAGMFESTDEAVWAQYERLKAVIAQENLPVDLYLGREYFCGDSFMDHLKTQALLPLGNGNTVLTEFSGRHTFELILQRMKQVQEAGYQPLIAHVERYPAVAENLKNAACLVEEGARLQVNASSLLGREGLRQKRFAWKLLKEGLAHVVASDAHDTQYRPQELGLCAAKIEKKLGRSRAQELLWEHPLHIILPQ